jgi:hypothetical protein
VPMASASRALASPEEGRHQSSSAAIRRSFRGHSEITPRSLRGHSEITPRSLRGHRAPLSSPTSASIWSSSRCRAAAKVSRASLALPQRRSAVASASWASTDAGSSCAARARRVTVGPCQPRRSHLMRGAIRAHQLQSEGHQRWGLSSRSARTRCLHARSSWLSAPPSRRWR